MPSLPVRPISRVLFALLLLGAGGCSATRRDCLPVEIAKQGPLASLTPPSDANNSFEPSAFDALTYQDRRTDPSAETGKRYQVLALSGGGMYGAYATGVLGGWSAAGTRPNFDVVTGISTGGLVATFAFLGPQYDATLVQLYTSISKDDIYRSYAKVSVLWRQSAADSEPLKCLIESTVDENVLRAVAAAHGTGRRLFVGTTNLDAKRFLIWDMGAIAASGRPESLELYRSILLASSSVPGFLPPVPISIRVNGQRYVEYHADGGVSTQVFLRASTLNIDREAIKAGRKPLAGSNAYIIIAGKLFADPECTKPKVSSIAANALSSLLYAQTRNDLVRIYSMTLATGLRYHETSIPQDLDVGSDSMAFDSAEMKRLYDVGYCAAKAGTLWRDTPPGVAGTEQVIPRTGTEFKAPTPAESRRRSSKK